MQRRKSSGFANGSVHGMARALRDFRGGPGGLIPIFRGWQRLKSRGCLATKQPQRKTNWPLPYTIEKCVDQRGLFGAERVFGRRSGMPTRAKATQAGGSLAGKVSIRLSTTMSSAASVVSIRRRGQAFARPFRLRWCGAVAWASSQILPRRPFRPVSDWPAVVATEV